MALRLSQPREKAPGEAGQDGYLVAVDVYALVEAGKLGEEDFIDLRTVQKQIDYFQDKKNHGIQFCSISED